METKALKCVTADKDNIGDYGTLVFTDNKTPGYESKEFSFWNRLGEMALSETASVCLVESHKTDRLTSSVFERHLNTSETLIPTDDIVIVIALPGNNGNKEPDWDTVKAFRIKKGDAIIGAFAEWKNIDTIVSDNRDFLKGLSEGHYFEVMSPQEFCESFDL